MAIEKLYQNRGVILGLTPRDAAVHAHHAEEDDVTFIGSAQQALTIAGSLGGMHVRTVYVTPHAATGLNYEKALETAKRCLAKSGHEGRVVFLESRG